MQLPQLFVARFTCAFRLSRRNASFNAVPQLIAFSISSQLNSDVVLCSFFYLSFLIKHVCQNVKLKLVMTDFDLYLIYSKVILS